jgi:hypothetical protein
MTNLRVLLCTAVLGAIALAGCSSSSSSSPTSTSSTSTTTTNSPQALAAELVEKLNANDLNAVCTLALPSEKAACASGATTMASNDGTYKNLVLGKVHVDGPQAVLSMTGSACAGSVCDSNTDPDGAFSKGQSFAEAFSSANAAHTGSPFYVPLIQQGGTWYVSGF